MFARARSLTLAFIGVVAALTAFAAIDRTRAVGTQAVTLSPATAEATRTFVVTSAEAGSRLHRGDRVELNDPQLLAALQLHSLRAGSTIALERISPGGRAVVTVPVHRVATSSFIYVFVPLLAMFLGMAFVVAARGTASGALSLAWFFALIVLLANPTTPSWPLPAILGYAVFSGAPGIFAFLCAIDFATRFTGAGDAPANRRLRRWAWTLGAVAAVVNIAVTALSFFTATTPVAIQDLAIGSLFLPAAGFIGALVFAYLSAPEAERQRALWVVGALGVGVLGLIVAIGESIAGVSEPQRDYPLLLLVASPLGCAYAILRYRLLDIGFVVNRAAVFGVTSLLVLAALALVDLGLQSILGSWLTRTGTFVQVGVALAIGIATRPLHARVDAVVDDLFFRERHAAERALRRFARDVAFIDDAAVALTRTVATVAAAARLRCSAFLAREREFRMAASSDGAPPLTPIGRNDGAVVRMLATRDIVDVRDVTSALAGEFAFPMFARNRLLGMLVCGGKSDGVAAYAPDELAAIAAVAHATGLALDLLRVEALERELERFGRAPDAHSAVE